MNKISTLRVSRDRGVRLSAAILAASIMVAMAPLSLVAGPSVKAVWATGGYHPNGLIPAPIGATLYVAATNATGDSHLLAINTQFGTITANLALMNHSIFPLVPSKGATQVAISKDGTLIFVVNYVSGTVDVVDQATNLQIGTFGFPAAGPLPIGVRVSPNGKQLWVACSATPPFFNNGTVKVISLESATFGEPLYLINTGASPNEVVFNSKGSVAYVLNGGQNGYLDEVNARTFQILRNNIAMGKLDSPHPLGMDLTKDNSTVYVSDNDSYIHNLDVPTGSIDDSIYMFPGQGPAVQTIGQVLVSPDQKWVVSADIDLGSVSVASTASQSFSSYVGLPVGSHPYFMAFIGRTLYVSNDNITTVGTGGGLLSISVISSF